MSATGEIVSVSTKVNNSVSVTGVSGVSEVGRVLVWSRIEPNQTSNFSNITPSQSSGFSNINPSQNPSWTNIAA